MRVFKTALVFVVVLVIGAGVLTGCSLVPKHKSDDDEPSHSQPSSDATEGEPSDQPSNSEPSSSEPSDQSSGPSISHPLQTDGFEASPCSAFNQAQLSQLGMRVQRVHTSAMGSKDCVLVATHDDANTMYVGAVKDNTHGLSDIYAQRDQFEYFEEGQVGEYPAVFASDTDMRSNGRCSLHVGLNDETEVMIYTEFVEPPEATNPCPVAAKVAGAMVQTLSGG